MERHESSVLIDRPIEEVWAFITDPFSIPRMGGGRLAIRVTSPGPIGIGSSLQQRVVIFGFETLINTVVTEWDPPRAATHSTPSSTSSRLVRSATFRTSLQRTATGTRAVRRAEFEPRGIMRLLWPIFWPFLRQRMDAQTHNLKRLVETPRP